jgi:hypothetical protein
MPRPLFTPGKDPVPIAQEAGPQGRSGQVRKISPPPGFNPRTIQPVVNRYTDYAIQPTKLWYILCINETEWHQIPEDHKLCSSFWVKSFVQCKLTTY